MQRTTEERHVPIDGPPLREVANGLIHDGLHDGQRNVGFRRAVVHERLDIRLGKDAATRGNRVNLLALRRQCVQPRGIRAQQRGHVVDERARAARADAVHALLRRVTEIRDFRILAAELHDRVRLRDKLAHGRGAGDNLLHKRQADTLRDTHARRARQGKAEMFFPDDLLEVRQVLLQGIANLRKMPRIILVENVFLMVEHHQLDSRRAHVNANLQK